MDKCKYFKRRKLKDAGKAHTHPERKADRYKVSIKAGKWNNVVKKGLRLSRL
jgi:hypothetical protein